MRETKPKDVTGKGGWRGTIARLPNASAQGERALVRLEDGREILVPLDALARQDDGSYYLPLGMEDLDLDRRQAVEEAGTALVVPVVEEEILLDKRTVETGVVRIRKVVREREELVDEPLLREEVQVERVPVNRFVDAPAEARREGDMTIIPVYEEVLVVEKRLLLKEEIRVTRRKIEVHDPQRVTTRSEEAIVDREDRESRQGLREREHG